MIRTIVLAESMPAAQEVPFASRPPKMSPGQKIDWDFTKMNFNMASGLVTITGVLEMANLFGQEDLCLVAERWE